MNRLRMVLAVAACLVAGCSHAPVTSPGDIARSLPGCGFVAVAGSTPRLSERVYPVRVFDIDGEGTPLAAAQHRLAAGTHVLLVEELIDASRFDAMQQDRRIRTRSRLGDDAAKELVVDVAADTRYRIGARLLPDRLDSAGINSNGYWEPVVWATEPVRCGD